jgi:hypothetical protein
VFLIGISLGVLPQPASAAPKVPPVQSLVVEYSLAPLTCSSDEITPVVNQPVLIMGVSLNTANIDSSVAQVTMLHLVTESDAWLQWVGLEPDSNVTATIAHGRATAPGTHIVFLDFFRLLDIQSATANTFKICNGSVLSQTGFVKLIW